jgi:hypothetical protein
MQALDYFMYKAKNAASQSAFIAPLLIHGVYD